VRRRATGGEQVRGADVMRVALVAARGRGYFKK
jgi:hypothetical protein